VKYFVSGGAGFIGSNIVDRLLANPGNEVVVYDNFTTGNIRFLEESSKNPRYKLVKGDLLDIDKLKKFMKGCDFVFHFAANADIRFGIEHPKKDLEQNTIATFNVLEAMRENGVKKIAFPSTGPVYGEAPVIPTPENCPMPIQTSLYGASKLACEGLIEAYCEGFGLVAYIFRFVSILGERYTHGHVFDFVRQLYGNPERLYILGNGEQRKSYLYIQDCLDAIFTIIEKAEEKINIYNLGADYYCEVNNSAEWISDEMGLTPKYEYSGGRKGWIGDNPFIYLDTTKVQKFGWKAKFTIEEGVRKTVRYLMANKWIIENEK